jgi:flagellar assembly protein FliH
MSSRVLGPDAHPPVEPMPWRTVQTAGPGGLDFPVEAAATGGDATDFERQIERRVREAHQSGLEAGEASSREKSAAELKAVMEKLARAVDELAGLRPRLRREAEADLMRLSLSIARRILRRELAIDPEALHGLILGALEKLQSQELSRVRVHPSHAALLTRCVNETVAGKAVEVIADASREPGTVIFETERGSLDASIETQLQEIERGLADRLRK